MEAHMGLLFYGEVCAENWPPTTEHLYAVECYEPRIECLHNKIPELRFNPKTSDTKDFPLSTGFYDFNPATVSSHHTTLTFKYTHIEIEGTRGGV
jgi:hypothetical protein